MNFLIGFVIGLVVGAVLLFFFQRQKFKKAEQKLDETRMVLEQVEALNKQYEARIQELEQSHQAQNQELEDEPPNP